MVQYKLCHFPIFSATKFRHPTGFQVQEERPCLGRARGTEPEFFSDAVQRLAHGHDRIREFWRMFLCGRIMLSLTKTDRDRGGTTLERIAEGPERKNNVSKQ